MNPLSACYFALASDCKVTIGRLRSRPLARSSGATFEGASSSWRLAAGCTRLLKATDCRLPTADRQLLATLERASSQQQLWPSLPKLPVAGCQSPSASTTEMGQDGGDTARERERELARDGNDTDRQTQSEPASLQTPEGGGAVSLACGGEIYASPSGCRCRLAKTGAAGRLPSDRAASQQAQLANCASLQPLCLAVSLAFSLACWLSSLLLAAPALLGAANKPASAIRTPAGIASD